MKSDHPDCWMPRTHDAEPGGSLRGLIAMLLAFYALWTGWALVILQFPSRLDGSPRERLVRAGIGLLLFLGPALFYIRHVERRPVLEFLRLREGWRRGLALGLGVATICLGPVIAWRLLATDARFVPAPDLRGWLNPVVFGPFKEEVLFRGVVFRKLDEGLPAPAAAILSALLFAAVHLPYWGLSGAFAGTQLLSALGRVFLLGLGLAVLYRFARSLWAPLALHWANNLVNAVLPG